MGSWMPIIIVLGILIIFVVVFLTSRFLSGREKKDSVNHMEGTSSTRAHVSRTDRNDPSMKIICRSCGNPITADNLDVKGRIATCTSCNRIFDSSAQLSGKRRKKRKKVALPKNMVMTRDIMHLEIARRWFGWKTIILTFFCLGWSGMMVYWYWRFISEWDTRKMVFAILNSLVGIILVYLTLAGYLNKTYIRADRDFLVIKHSPLPWFGNRSIPSHELDQLYSKRYGHRTKAGVQYTYDLRARTRSEQDIKLLSNLPKSHPVLFVEQEIERFLNIEDRPVKGEMKR